MRAALALATALLAADARALSITNTESVHALAFFAGRVVACTEGGLDLFRPGGGHERTLHVEDGLPSHFCRALEPVGGSLFVATDAGVVEIDGAWRMTPVLAAAWQGLPPAGGRDAAAYRAELKALQGRLPRGLVWTAFGEGHAGTADGRLFRLGDLVVRALPGAVERIERHGAVLRVATTEVLHELEGDRVTGATALPGPMGFGPGGLVVTADGTTLEWGRAARRLDVQGPRDASCVLRVGSNWWFGTRAQGVHERRGRRPERVTPTGQLCGNHVVAIDRHEGRLVVGTFDRGACWLAKSGRWTTFRQPALPMNQVYSLGSDGKRLFVSTPRGLGLWDGKHWRHVGLGGRNPFGLKKLAVLSVLPGADGTLLVDARGASLVADGRLARRDALPEGWSQHVSVAARGGRWLWVGSEDRGLVRFDGERWEKFHDGRDLADNWVTAIAADEQGRALAGSCQDGLAWFDGAKWKRLRLPHGAPQADIASVEIANGLGIVGTLGGAFVLDPERMTFTELQGVPDPRVYAVRAEQDALWLGTEGGLASLAMPK